MNSGRLRLTASCRLPEGHLLRSLDYLDILFQKCVDEIAKCGAARLRAGG
jgi:hypothetical protein